MRRSIALLATWREEYADMSIAALHYNGVQWTATSLVASAIDNQRPASLRISDSASRRYFPYTIDQLASLDGNGKSLRSNGKPGAHHRLISESWI